MRKLMLLAAGALTALPFVALPAGASAEEMEAHCSSAPCEGVVQSTGTVKLTDDSGLGYVCQKITGTVTQSAATSKTVNVILTIDTCTDPFGGKCTTAGETAGNILTNTMVGHLITVTKGNPATASILLTGANIDFVCAFVGTRLVTGNMIGTITNPQCGIPATHHTFLFTQSGSGQQAHKTYTGSTFDLLSSGTTFSTTVETHLTYTGGKTVTITC